MKKLKMIKGCVPTKAVREYLKRTGESIVDINWNYLRPGVIQRILREEIIRDKKLKKNII